MCAAFIESVNRDTTARSLESARLISETEQLLSGTSVSGVRWDGPQVFAAVPVYVSREHLSAMAKVVDAVIELSQSPVFQEQVLSASPAIAKERNLSHGVFFGYDFHLTESGPKLIEVNTNAGGAMLSLLMSKAHPSELTLGGKRLVVASDLLGLESSFVNMFLSDWRLSRGNGSPRTIAIVDDKPTQQFLYREFLLYQALLERASIQTHILAPEELVYERGSLRQGELEIDLVYNRLVDFYLEDPRHQALRSAYLDGAVVVTPHPRAHALFADKRNLIRYRDQLLLNQAGLSAGPREVLERCVPETRLVRPEISDEFWRERKSWFFKPISGYGSKATYQGAKLTKSTFAEILTRDYVAQRLVPPSERLVEVDGRATELKFDVRAYTYESKIVLWAARMYSGQTTNFRTLGGGFAPVFTTP